MKNKIGRERERGTKNNRQQIKKNTHEVKDDRRLDDET